MSKRLGWLTPDSIPDTSKCRVLFIPDDVRIVAAVSGALYQLTKPYNWEQFGLITPNEMASSMLDMLDAYYTSTGNCGGDMNCNDVLQCIVSSGYTLTPTALPEDQRVVNGVPQVSFDGGTTWVDVFGDTSAEPIVKAPSATSGANDSAKICLASTRAALVLAEFYKQTFGAFTADITNALGTFNNFMKELNSALLGLAYGQAAQMLNAEILRGQDFETNYTAAELSSGALDDLLCLLVDNASVDASGVVTFDYDAIRDNVISDVGINPGTALWFLLGNIQEAGLNAAGSVHVTDTPLDCSGCGDWCIEFDFTQGQYGWYNDVTDWQRGTYSAGVGFITTNGQDIYSTRATDVYIRLDFTTPANITGVSVLQDYAKGSGNMYCRVLNVSGSVQINQRGTCTVGNDIEWSKTGINIANATYVMIRSQSSLGAYGGSAKIKRVRITGTGVKPVVSYTDECGAL